MADIDLKPTAQMAANAERGLALRKEHGRGGTEVGVARARDISNRTNLSPDTVRRMHSYFARHEVDKKGEGWGEDSAGYIAWLLWGGDEGKSWADRKVKELDRKQENARMERGDELARMLDKDVTLANHKQMAKIVNDAIVHAKKVGDDDLLELAEEVGHEIMALRSRASRLGAKAKFAYKVGDRVHGGWLVRGGAGIVGTITKIEDGYAYIQGSSDRFGPVIHKVLVHNLSDPPKKAYESSKSTRPGAKAKFAAVNPQAVNIAKNVIAYPNKYASMSPDEKDRIGEILERLEDDASFDGNGEIERLASKAIALMIAHSITAKNRARSKSSRPATKSKHATDEAVSRKIKKLMDEGYPQDQAVAIALDMKRKGKI